MFRMFNGCYSTIDWWTQNPTVDHKDFDQGRNNIYYMLGSAPGNPMIKVQCNAMLNKPVGCRGNSFFIQSQQHLSHCTQRTEWSYSILLIKIYLIPSGVNHDWACLHKRLHSHAAIDLMCAWPTMNACTSARALPRSQHIFGSWTISTCTQFVWPSCTKVSKCVCVIWGGGREMVINWKVRQVTHTHGNPRWGEFEIYRHTVQRQWLLEYPYAWMSGFSSFW